MISSWCNCNIYSMSSQRVSNWHHNSVVTSRHQNYAVMAVDSIYRDNIVATLNRHWIDIVYKYLIFVKMSIRHRRDVIAVSIRCHHDLSNRHRNGVVVSRHRNDAVTANLTMSILFIVMISWRHWIDIELTSFTNIWFL